MRAWLSLCAALLVTLLSITRSQSRATGVVDPVQSSVRLELSVRDEAGRPLTARARVAPLHWAERVRLGLFDDIERVLPAGAGTITLARGAYRVLVSRGPEWQIAELRLDAESAASLRREVTLAHEVALPGWRGADLHVHTERSPDAAEHGGVSGSELAAEGIELAVATDHNQIGDLGPGCESIAGAEITTWAPEIGHFNAFPLQRMPRWRGTDPRALVRELARDPGVFVQVNHPRLEAHIAYFELGGFDGARFARDDYHLEVDGLEVWNGYDIGRPERVQRLLREWRGWVARGRRLTPTGGSDSHGADNHRPGYPRTYVRAEAARELAPALKAGRAFVSNGPLLSLSVQGAAPGAVLAVPADALLEVELQVMAASWLHVRQLELWLDDSLAWSIALPLPRSGQPLRFRESLWLNARGARSVTAIAHGGSGLERLLGRADVSPLAFTNAVHLVPAAAAPANLARR